MNSTAAIIFYSKLGFFTLNLAEELNKVNSFISHNTSIVQNFIRGHSLPFKYSEIGLVFFAIQAKIYEKVIFARSAGCYGKVIKKQSTRVFIQLPSFSIYVLSALASATLGLSSKKYFRKMTKAGHARYIN
jgi:ribosomal protein L2